MVRVYFSPLSAVMFYVFYIKLLWRGRATATTANKTRTFSSVFLLYLAALTRSNRRVMVHHMCVLVATTHKSLKPRVVCGLSSAGFLWYVYNNLGKCLRIIDSVFVSAHLAMRHLPMANPAKRWIPAHACWIFYAA